MRKILVAALVAVGAVMSVRAADAIPFRGVVEGYYGRPWGTEGRLSLLKFMGENDMNVFIYGPKDDPYHHGKWREPYPGKEMADFQKLLKAAQENKVLFTWAIHLGGSFKKGSEEDYQALFRKFGWMYDAGVRAFAVFFDDFGSADADFHAEICNRVVTDFLAKKKDCAPLVMCPNVYWGSGHPYQKALGAKLDKRVNIMWTGRWICHDINAEDVKKITADFQRPPYIWWNWPVNDYCRTKVLLGRTYGLDQGTYAGFVSNPMENCEANKIALYGIAKWCKDPANFDSKKTWEESFAKIYKDPEVAEAMRIFAEHNSDQSPNGHGYRREESVAAAPLCAKAREEYAKSGTLTPETLGELVSLFSQVGGATGRLMRKLPTDKGLGWELKGWLDAENAQMREGMLALRLLQAKTAQQQDKILAKLREVRSEAVQSAAAHRTKFAEATFERDRRSIKSPRASTLVLEPTVLQLLEGELRKIYRNRTGKDIDAVSGLAAFSDTKSMPSLVVGREGKIASINAVLEPREVKPGESFGLAIPKGWGATYFHARLGNENAQKKGVVELSRDGSSWTAPALTREGGQIHGKLDPKDGWCQARYRNASDETVTVKLNLFKFDVSVETSVVDQILEALEK